MLCANNHQVPNDANFCPVCGIGLIAFKTGAVDTQPGGALNMRSVLDVPNFFSRQARDNVSGYGRNHEYMAQAVAPAAGQTLPSATLGEMTMRRFPEFNPGSLLFNDHAVGNKGSCRCAGTEDRIFDRKGRGYYTVRDLGVIETAPAKIGAGSQPEVIDLLDLDNFQDDLSQGQMFSNWLVRDAIDAIESKLQLPNYRLEVLSGNRRGRYPSIGIKILGQQAWAIGFDNMCDFNLDGLRRPTKRPYCGWRGGSSYTGSGEEGRQRHLILKKIFPGDEWLRPDQWWSTYRDLPFEGNGSVMLNGQDYRNFVINTYIDSFKTLLAAAQQSQSIQ